MKKNLFNNLLTSLLSILVFSFLLVGSLEVVGQSCQFQQGQNGGVGLPVVSPVQFERGNSNASKSHFAEGFSVPYRIEFTTLESNQQYKVRISFDVKKNGKIAFDYITGFQNLQLHQSRPAELVDPLVGTSLESVTGIGSSYLAIPSPTYSTNSSFNSTASTSFSQLKTAPGLNPETTLPTSGYSASLRNKGNMVIWNATLNSVQYVGGLDISPSTVSVSMDVVFTKANNSNNVVLAWGGHIASLLDWGQGNSASSIPGSPYHMFVETVVKTSNNDVICNGNMDCQIAADAVTPVPTCSITGPSTLCESSTLVNYKAVLDASQNGTISYNWSLVNLSPSSTPQLVGSGSGTSVTDTLWQQVIPSDSFLVRLRVERGGIYNYCYLNAVDSPGTKVKKINIEVQAQATPSSISLNSVSTTQLSTSVLVDGIATSSGLTYQWTIIGPGGFAAGSLSSSTISNPVFTASMSGEYTLKVLVTQAESPNCVDSAQVTITVFPSQSCPSLITQSVCTASQVSVPVLSLPQTGVDYNWVVTNGASIISEGGDTLLTILAGAQDFEIQLQLSYVNPLLSNLVCSYPVTVHPLPLVSAGQYGPSCETAIPISLEGFPSGGSWSGVGVSGGLFDPSIAGAGTHKVYYTYTDTNGCTNIDSTSIIVNEIPTLYLGSYGPLCVNASSVSLSATPAGGSWSGTGVSGASFDPSVAGVGTHAVSYQLPVVGGCTADTTIEIEVKALPELSVGSYGPLCAEGAAISLSATPSGGSWSGTGVSGSSFNPSVAGAGTHKVYYTYTDTNGCTGIDSTSIVVNEIPTLYPGSYGPLCVNASSVSLSATPAGGSWSGTGVSGASFDPSVAGVGTHAVSYQLPIVGGCTADTTIEIEVKPLPELSVGSYGPLCAEGAAISLSATPSGGSWSGNGVSGSSFNPSVAGAGTHKVYYTYTDTNGCTGIDSTSIVVNEIPTLYLGSYGPLCAEGAAISLSATPSGGSWSGNGVSGSSFNPSVAGAGTHKVYYTYTDTNGCTGIDSTSIVVNEIPTLYPGSYGPLCVDASPVFLSATPEGGSWSGVGVSGGLFDPSIAGAGTHKVYYTYTDTNGCTGIDSTSIVVNEIPTLYLGSYGPLCAEGAAISLSATPSGGSWSGTGVSGSSFNPSVAGAGTHKVYYTYTDTNGCTGIDSTSIVVNEIPTLYPGSYGPLCVDASPVFLSATPEGGSWSGTGVTGNTFDPSEAGVGTHTVTYQLPVVGGCTADTTIEIEVKALPELSVGSYGPLCAEGAAISLSATPSGGSWSGTGVSGSSFNPSVAGVGTHVLTYYYSDSFGCSAVSEVSIQVNDCAGINACTLTQGYYGSTNGASCDEDSLYRNAVSIIKKLLTSGPIIIGSGGRTLTINVNDSARLNSVMPGGGTPYSFTHSGNITLQSTQFSVYKTSKGKINNILLSQTIALALNNRIKPDLTSFELQNGYLHTQRLRTCFDAGEVSLVSCEEDPTAIRAWYMIPSVVNYLRATSAGTVLELLNLANAVLGRTKLPGQVELGGAVVPSLGDIVAQINVINNAFDQCRLSLGYFESLNLCPVPTLATGKSIGQEEAQVSVIKELQVNVFPNPFGTTLNVNIKTPEKTKVSIELFDLQGKLLRRIFVGELQAQENRQIQLVAPVTAAPIMYRVTTANKIFSGVLLPSN